MRTPLCDTFGTQFAGVCRVKEDEGELALKSVIFRAGDSMQDPIVYKAKGSPCDLTLEKGAVTYLRDAYGLFPHDEFMQELKIQQRKNELRANAALSEWKAGNAEALVTEAARVERHGFTASELDREKRNLLRVYDQALAEKDKDESGPLAAEYIRNFLTGESLPGIAWEHQMHVRFLPGITLAEVNALAKEWNGDHNRVVAVSAPHRDVAFDSARFAIDALKATVPIWKREIWEDGESWGLEAQHLVDVESFESGPAR